MTPLPLSAGFLTSASRLSQCPPPSHAEVAFLGRSNVGKSSLINALVERKGLAKSSQTPGKTRLINFFESTWKVEEGQKVDVGLVDLPGFGYAKVSKSLKEEWERNLSEFLKKRESLALLILLRDARHPDLELDEQVKEYLQGTLRPNQALLEVYTKMDKLKSTELSRLKQKKTHSLIVSAPKKTGIPELRERMLKMALEVK